MPNHCFKLYTEKEIIMRPIVSVKRCDEYDVQRIEKILRQQFEEAGIDTNIFSGKRVAVKPNLVVAQKNNPAACTNPAVTEAAARIAVEAGGDVVIAESPGGPFTVSVMKHNYKVNGLIEVSENSGAALNYDMGFRTLSAPDAKNSMNFNVINAIADADVIIDVCKLKTHTLTGMTCAVKNLFGVIPGTQKVEMHARFSNQQKFGSVLIDLCDMLCSTKKVICVCDAIVGMEGNGPSGGSPRNIGCLIVSENPYALDAVAADIIGHTGEIPMIEEAKHRGLCPRSDDIVLRGDNIEEFKVSDYRHSDAKRGRIFSILPPFLQPRPAIITGKCIGCGSCAESCPVHTISVKNGKAVIGRKQCIKCFCCQELCPIHAVEIKKNFLFKLVR